MLNSTFPLADGECSIQIEVYVDKLTASRFNRGEDSLEDILVLHLQGGKDLFITINGSYVTSSYGASIEALTYMFAPIRDLSAHDLHVLEKRNSTTAPSVDTVSTFTIVPSKPLLFSNFNGRYLSEYLTLSVHSTTKMAIIM